MGRERTQHPLQLQRQSTRRSGNASPLDLHRHEAFTRARLAPDWVFYLCSVLGLLASAVGVAVIFISPWIPSLMNTTQWDLWIGGIGVISLIIGALIFFIGQATIRTNVSDEQVIAEVTGEKAAG